MSEETVTAETTPEDGEKRADLAAPAEAKASVGEPAAAAELGAEPAPEPVAEPAPEPAAVPPVPKQRQWVTLRGSSMDLRVGESLLDGCAHDLTSAIGRPRACVLAAPADAPADVVEAMRRGLTDQGFAVHGVQVPSGDAAHDAARVLDVYAELARAGITADDLVVAVGDEAALSLVCAACQRWCGTTMYAEVPCDLAGAVVSGPTPRPLDAGGLERCVGLDGSARFELCDLDVLLANSSEENVLLARALMAQSAMVDSDKAFGKLWDASEDIVSGDRAALANALVEAIRSRGKVSSSSSVAIRQSMAYGETIRSALRAVVPAEVPESSLLAESMRFAARLSVASESFSIDDMFTQDELLERLGLGTVACPVDADALLEAIRRERFSRTNRFMLALPRAIGRVRLTAVDAEALEEHVRAWCASR